VAAKTAGFLAGPVVQYGLAVVVFICVSLLDLWLQDLIGYQAIALVNLLAVVVLALFVSRGPILLGTALTAAGWNFFAVPPRFSFHVSGFYDKMMFATYFAVALTIGELTSRLRVHREAEIRTKLLAESERLGRTLLNSVSHELRTPIAAITAAVGELRASGSLPEQERRLTGEIELACARLNRVVQSLLSAARLQSGHLRPKPDWCEPADLVRLAMREAALPAAGHPMAVKLGTGLPLVKMDLVLTAQALANLLVNAATHTPPGTPIELAARVEAKHLVLEVADRGPGLPPGQLERVFDLFHRAPAARPGGAGLGLAIVKGFIEAQGGTVNAANRPGGGAVFTLILPASAAPELPQEPS
jgi:two-component system sensor histidine kinase KdpD